MRVLLIERMVYLPAVGAAHKGHRSMMEDLAVNHDCRVVTWQTDGRVSRTPADFEAAVRAVGASVEAKSEADIFRCAAVEVHAVRERTALREYAVRQLTDFDPDCILVACQDPGQILLEAALQSRRAKVVYVSQTTQALPMGPRAAVSSPRGLRLLRACHGITASSSYLARCLYEWAGLEAAVLPFNLYGRGPFPELGNFDDGYVTIINPRDVNGIDIFLALADQRPDIQFAAVPTWGTNERDLAALAARSNVTLLPQSENIDDILRQTKIMLAPKLWDESFGTIIVESMLRGVPVIASDAGGQRETMNGQDFCIPVHLIGTYQATSFGGETSVRPIVPPQDIEPWLEAIDLLQKDKRRYEALSASSRVAAHQFLETIRPDAFDRYLREVVGRESVGDQTQAGASRTFDTSRLALLALKALPQLRASRAPEANSGAP